MQIRFSCPSAAVLDGLDRVAGVADIGFDGASAIVRADAGAVVRVAAALERRELSPHDFTVIRPSLEDAVISMLDGGTR